MLDVKEISARIKKILSKYRYDHSVSVGEYAAKLAILHGLNPTKAYIAGLLHDIAKELTDEEIYKLVKNDPRFKTYPNISTLHGVAGSYLAQKLLKITDKDMIEAISKHVIPNRRVSKLAMIIFICDKLEYSREEYPVANANKLRALAEKNLTKAFIQLRAQLIQ
jgi:predicted HD superfamily hydrolase involved in NAD metabolism